MRIKKILIFALAVYLVYSIIPVKNTPKKATQDEVKTPVVSEPKEEHKVGSFDASTDITLLVNDKVETLKLDAYLKNVIAAEMPASFPDEALRAQAVAARTYTMYKVKMAENSSKPDDVHKGAQLCADYTHCKAYNTKTDEELWGRDGEFYSKKVVSAVALTDGIIAEYEGEPIAAVFHAASGPKTENGSDVWGGDAPYLKSCESPGGELSPKYYGNTKCTTAEFAKKIKEAVPEINLGPNSADWILGAKRSEAGGIITINIAGTDIKGTKMRTLFGLNSTNFIMKIANEQVEFSTVGYGHGVGMSQYGARAMAENGASFDEIIKYYYKDVELIKK